MHPLGNYTQPPGYAMLLPTTVCLKCILTYIATKMDMEEHNPAFILCGSLVSWPEAWGINIFEI